MEQYSNIIKDLLEDKGYTYVYTLSIIDLVYNNVRWNIILFKIEHQICIQKCHNW